jgi:hypothetical protein
MDKQEAERVAKAIRKMPVEWMTVRRVEWNHTSNTYEVTCAYKQRHTKPDAAWTEIHISTPRQWIDLLTQRGPDGDGLELP